MESDSEEGQPASTRIEAREILVSQFGVTLFQGLEGACRQAGKPCRAHPPKAERRLSDSLGATRNLTHLCFLVV